MKVWKLNDWWIMLYFEYSVDALTIKWKIISRSKETRMTRKREAFKKKKLCGFLLILGLHLILACQSWSQIQVLGLGRDKYVAKIPYNLKLFEDILDLAEDWYWFSYLFSLHNGQNTSIFTTTQILFPTNMVLLKIPK